MGDVYKKLTGGSTRPTYLWIEGSKGTWIYPNKPTTPSALNWGTEAIKGVLEARYELEYEDITLEEAEIFIKLF